MKNITSTMWKLVNWFRRNMNSDQIRSNRFWWTVTLFARFSTTSVPCHLVTKNYAWLLNLPGDAKTCAQSDVASPRLKDGVVPLIMPHHVLEQYQYVPSTILSSFQYTRGTPFWFFDDEGTLNSIQPALWSCQFSRDPLTWRLLWSAQPANY